MSYIAQSNIIHNKVEYKTGEEVLDLSEAEAVRLIKDGVVRDGDVDAQPATPPASSVPEASTPDADAEKKPGLLGRIFGAKPDDVPAADATPPAPPVDPSANL